MEKGMPTGEYDRQKRKSSLGMIGAAFLAVSIASGVLADQPVPEPTVPIAANYPADVELTLQDLCLTGDASTIWVVLRPIKDQPPPTKPLFVYGDYKTQGGYVRVGGELLPVSLNGCVGWEIPINRPDGDGACSFLLQEMHVLAPFSLDVPQRPGINIRNMTLSVPRMLEFNQCNYPGTNPPPPPAEIAFDCKRHHQGPTNSGCLGNLPTPRPSQTPEQTATATPFPPGAIRNVYMPSIRRDNTHTPSPSNTPTRRPSEPTPTKTPTPTSTPTASATPLPERGYVLKENPQGEMVLYMDGRPVDSAQNCPVVRVGLEDDNTEKPTTYGLQALRENEPLNPCIVMYGGVLGENPNVTFYLRHAGKPVNTIAIPNEDQVFQMGAQLSGILTTDGENVNNITGPVNVAVIVDSAYIQSPGGNPLNLRYTVNNEEILLEIPSHPMNPVVYMDEMIAGNIENNEFVPIAPLETSNDAFIVAELAYSYLRFGSNGSFFQGITTARFSFPDGATCMYTKTREGDDPSYDPSNGSSDFKQVEIGANTYLCKSDTLRQQNRDVIRKGLQTQNLR